MHEWGDSTHCDRSHITGWGHNLWSPSSHMSIIQFSLKNMFPFSNGKGLQLILNDKDYGLLLVINIVNIALFVCEGVI